MHKLIFSRFLPNGTNTELTQDLLLNVLKAINRAKAQKVRLYRTFVADDVLKYTFVTTVKDLHLELGILEADEQVQLAQLLHGVFSEQGCSQLLVFPEDKSQQKAIFVTLLQKENKEVTFHLSFAH